jgi:F-type H+-transporting ATPase subunit b
MVVLAFAEDSIQLIPDGTLLLNVIIIVVMVAVLNRTLLKPINNILKEREALTAGRLSEAEKTVARVHELLAQYEQELRQARADGYRLMEQQRLAALRVREQKLNDLKDEISASVSKEKAALADQAGALKNTLAAEAHQLAQEISSQILRRPVH